jgi:pyruvate,water dikinase
MGKYLDTVLPVYGEHFADWWHDRLVPEMQRNFDYLEGRLDEADGMSLAELATLLEDAIDIHDRTGRSTGCSTSPSSRRRSTCEPSWRGPRRVDEELLGRLQNSASDRNWDSIEALWRMKNEVRDDPRAAGAFGPETRRRSRLPAGSTRAALHRRAVTPYQREFGWHAVWSHEFIFPTVREEMEPMLELVRGYLDTDYDYPTAIEAMRRDIEAASSEILAGSRGGARGDARRQRDQPAHGAAHPDHHFYIDQGANAHVRLVLIAIGRKLVEAGRLDLPDDVLFLRYNELRMLIGDADALDARERLRSAVRSATRPSRSSRATGSAPRRRRSSPSRISSTGATRSGSPEASADTTTVKGIAGSPGVPRASRASC